MWFQEAERLGNVRAVFTHWYTAARHTPRLNGRIERSHQTDEREFYHLSAGIRNPSDRTGSTGAEVRSSGPSDDGSFSDV